ncbi:hypothetical protein ABT297_42975 [Dactylosporangium sp. NPDC000555]|uniref:hypothetical protein n=1 Tax=Dactylosporangium sp. NPDC000555 TaxID=3154260 RepID=UPI00332A0506
MSRVTRSLRLALLAVITIAAQTVTAAAPAAAAGPPSDAPRAALRAMAEDVAGADASVYGARDDTGRGMDAVKIIQVPDGRYLAVYHTYLGGSFHSALAISSDLLHWSFRRDFGAGSSQPTITVAGSGYVVAWEQEPANHLAFRYFTDLGGLMGGPPQRSFDAPWRLSQCAEGTPSIFAVSLRPDIDHSVIDVGGHYFKNCDVDRQQRGTLTNFMSWSTAAQPLVDNALLHWGVRGNIGDRDPVGFAGFAFTMMEGQYVKGDFGSWRTFLFDQQTGNADPVNMRTHRGSTAFANPTATTITAPDGRRAVVFTTFIPSEGAAPTEAGSLIYYRVY